MSQFGRMPTAEEHSLPPDKRPKHERILIDPPSVGFVIQRNIAFSPELNLGKLMTFMDQFKIPYPQPYLLGVVNQNFWHMIYAAILCSECGSDGTFERATIWLYTHQDFTVDTLTATYRVNKKPCSLHTLLKARYDADSKRLSIPK